MLRLILRLLGIKDFEVCKSCETLKQQLLYIRNERDQMIDVLLLIVKPKVVEAQTPIEINPVQQTSALFSRRRAALEAKDREEARIKKMSQNIGKPDDQIEKLEQELGIEVEA